MVQDQAYTTFAESLIRLGKQFRVEEIESLLESYLEQAAIQSA